MGIHREASHLTAQPSPPPERLHALDSLRAAAMLLGIVLHSATSFMVSPFRWPAHDVSRSVEFDVMFGFIHGFRMQVFYLLAGFFGHLLWQRLGVRGFLIQRSQRVGIPLLLGMVTIVPLIFALWSWADSLTGSRFSAMQLRKLTILSYPTAHLWFLEMLLLLYVATAAIAWCGKSLVDSSALAHVDMAFDWLIQQRLKPFLLVPPTVWALWGGPVFGEIDIPGARLLPAARAVAYYGLFFAIGWWLHRRLHLLDALRHWVKLYFTVAMFAFLTWGGCLAFGVRPTHPNFTEIKVLALVAASLYAWTMTFALTGLVLRIAARHRAWVRYLADASYWWYLWHLPLVMWLQVHVAKWQFSGWLKVPLILLVTIAILLPSYQWLVRYTWVGRMLNGPRLRPDRPGSGTECSAAPGLAGSRSSDE